MKNKSLNSLAKNKIKAVFIVLSLFLLNSCLKNNRESKK